MKKRILALALAGTTAFSVFGAAMSANAAGTSTHTWYDNDKYVSYTGPAEKINVKNKATVVGEAGKYTDLVTKTADAAKSVIEAQAMAKENYERKFWIQGSTIFGTPVAAKDAYAIADHIKDLNDTDYATALADLYITNKDDKGNTLSYFKYAGYSYTSLEDAVNAYLDDVRNTVGESRYTWNYWPKAGTADSLKVADSGKGVYDGGEIEPKTYDDLPTMSKYFADHVIYGANKVYDGTVKVTDARRNVTDSEAWKFNGTTSDVMDTAVSPSGVIYAYDFYWNNNFYSSAADVAAVWYKGDDAIALAMVNGETTENGVDFVAEGEFGKTNKGVRAEVISDWVDFLEELAIYNDGRNYYESEAAFVSSYVDLYYNDPVYSRQTGKLVGYNPIDLYNLDDLLHDIYMLNNDAAIAEANTSEMVYLMQQYNKYIGDYITPSDAETSEWGELLLGVLESAESDDFKKPNDYKKYVREVEDLADAYEAATTSTMITTAEQGMYNLLVKSTYTANGSADKSELAATMSGLFFNAKNVPSTYTENDGTAVYTNYKYEAFENVKYYALYPMADYGQQGNYNKNAVYTGNAAAKDDPYIVTTYVTYDHSVVAAESTDEYQWFWNVYQLAYNMNKGNKYQGSIDAINEALNDAVDALAVVTAPKSSEVAAKEEAIDAYAGMIDSDYNAGYYAKYAQAMDYAENVAEGKYQTLLAADIVGIAGGSLTYQGTQITVTKNDITSLKASIADANKAIEAIKSSDKYNAAQMTALNKAIATAEDLVALYEGSLYTAPNWYGDRYANLLQSVNHINYTGRVGDKDQMVKSDIENAISAINAAIDYSEIVMGWSKNEDGKWQYGETDGYVQSGWKKLDSVWYYFDNGVALQSAWKEIDGKWYWFNSNCGAAYGWAKVNGEWYYFGGDNAMKTGWVKVDGNWYYLAASGKMTTGWVQVDGKWYYMSKESNSLGQMLANTTVEGYKLGADGAMIEK